MSVLEKFKLVELITSRTDSVATFMNGNQIKFNAATFVDLGYPEYIQLFVEEKGKQFAILRTGVASAVRGSVGVRGRALIRHAGRDPRSPSAEETHPIL